MIEYNYEIDFLLPNEDKTSKWITQVISLENYKLDLINYVFCNDDYLHKLNVEFLKHDTLTDVISFDYTVGKLIQGDIFISIERVRENASDFNTPFYEELLRVMVHGVLHYCGYKDKLTTDEILMRTKEDYYLKQII